jgi:hypothetical protein
MFVPNVIASLPVVMHWRVTAKVKAVVQDAERAWAVLEETKNLMKQMLEKVKRVWMESCTPTVILLMLMRTRKIVVG